MSREREQRIRTLRLNIEARQSKANDTERQRQIVVHQQEMIAILKAFRGADFVGFIDLADQVNAPEKLYWAMRRRLEPTTTVSESAPDSKKIDWFRSTIKNLGNSDEYLIAFDKYIPFMSWVKIRPHNAGRWLYDLWCHLESEKLIVLSADQRMMFGVYTAEYDYLGYVYEIPKLKALQEYPD